MGDASPTFLKDRYENAILSWYIIIFLDDTLTWSHHIDTVYSKLMKYVDIFLANVNYGLLHCLNVCECVPVLVCCILWILVV